MARSFLVLAACALAFGAVFLMEVVWIAWIGNSALHQWDVENLPRIASELKENPKHDIKAEMEARRAFAQQATARRGPRWGISLALFGGLAVVLYEVGAKVLGLRLRTRPFFSDGQSASAAPSDYYSVLGVSPSANYDEIQRAFRREAQRCHPDRGGSHDAIKQVIEAWEVLSNADSRSRYDAARSAAATAEEKQTAEADTAKARRKASRFQPVWDDFVRAEFRHEPTFYWGLFPHAGNSLTGWLFVFAGFFSGAICGGMFDKAWKESIVLSTHRQLEERLGVKITKTKPDPPERDGLSNLFLIGFAVAGAGLGASAHKGVSHLVSRQGLAKRAVPIANRTIRCLECGRKLRIPTMTAELSVRCPDCKARFTVPAKNDT